MTFANSLLLIKQDSFMTKEYYMWNCSLKHDIFSKLEVVVHLPCTEACARGSLEQEDEDEDED